MNNLRRTVLISGKKATITITSNGNTGTVTATSGVPVNAQKIWLGCGADAGNPVAGSMFVGNIYAFSITRGGAKLLDLIPARVSGVVGMWDKVT